MTHNTRRKTGKAIILFQVWRFDRGQCLVHPDCIKLWRQTQALELMVLEKLLVFPDGTKFGFGINKPIDHPNAQELLTVPHESYFLSMERKMEAVEGDTK